MLLRSWWACRTTLVAPSPPALVGDNGYAVLDLLHCCQVLEWFVLRWSASGREVTPYQVRGRLFQEVRTHLGVETQRRWSDLAIPRTTPILLGLFSWTALAAHALQQHHPITQRTAAWYDPPEADRRLLWTP